MNILRTAILSSFIFVVQYSQAQPSAEAFRIVGYYSLTAALHANVDSFPFEKVTHVNLFFLNPDSTGAFVEDLSGLSRFVQAAHKRHVKVLPSIAGGGRHDYYHELLRPGRRSKLVSDLVNIVVKNNLDGLDVDLEGSDIDENYEVFVKELKAALAPKQKILTAAIAVFYKDQLSDQALSQFDFMNLMSYDHTGPWNPSKPGPHSTYEHALTDLAYFVDERRIPKEKLVLGVGFYGYGFGPELNSPPSSLSYKDIVEHFPGSDTTDQQTLAGGSIMYYNGIPTIKRKTILAMEKASGVMVWQLMGDAVGDKSLLNIIRQTSMATGGRRK
jgi:chitinase